MLRSSLSLFAVDVGITIGVGQLGLGTWIIIGGQVKSKDLTLPGALH